MKTRVWLAHCVPVANALATLLLLLLPQQQAGAQSATAALDITITDAQGRPLNEAVVALLPARGPLSARPGTRAEMEQKDRQFHPRVLAIQTGTTVDFPNHDTVRHHVYSFSPTKTFELKLYIGMPAAPVVFDQAGTAVLGCNIHDQMAAWVRVVDTPYFGVSAAGQVRLASLPAGTYRVQVWHPAWPEGQSVPEQNLSVAAGAQSLQLKLPLPQDRPL